MIGYEIWLDDAYGRRLILLDHISEMTAIKTTNTDAPLILALPPEYDRYLKLDGIIEVWRRAEGGGLKLFNAYFIRKWSFKESGNVPVTVVRAYDGTSLLNRRIVAYAAGSTEAEKTAEADDMAKAIVREAATTATDTDRRWTALNFAVAQDETQAPSVTQAFSYRNVLETLRDIAEASRKNGTRLYFDIVPIPQDDGTLGWEFRTYIDQPGIDHATNDQIVFSPAYGNLKEPNLTFDHVYETTVVYAGGQGLEAERIVSEVEDTDRSQASPWNRTEAFYNCSGQAETTAQVTAAGEAKLSELKPLLEFLGTLTDTPSSKFGIDWQFGDRVVISYRGYQYEAVINLVELYLSGKGQETLAAGFEVLA